MNRIRFTAAGALLVGCAPLLAQEAQEPPGGPFDESVEVRVESVVWTDLTVM